jgi:pyrrolidone-carboxylate peptidase
MNSLVYGFEPFLQHTRNVTADIVRALPGHRSLHAEVLPVRFDATMFRRLLRTHRPGIVIGLGMHPRARKLRVERCARNARAQPGQAVRQIQPQGPEKRFLSLLPPRCPRSTRTYDAGSYVCNFSMWIVDEYARRHGLRSAFIHVPRDYPVDDGRDYVLSLLDWARRG